MKFNMTKANPSAYTTAKNRLLSSLFVGLLAAWLVIVYGSWEYAPLIAWDTVAIVYAGWVWLTILPMKADKTKLMAVREEPGRTSTEILLIGASLASLVAVGFLISQAGNTSAVSKGAGIFLGLFSVIASWIVVQTIHTLKYAKLYYDGTEGGIDFNESSPPRYTDFAYLAFTLGMTFQVSDTDIKTKEIRAAALKHSLLSYVFGTVIIATTINTIASLGK